ncbi:MAG TPA: hypothetical protein VGK24_08875, partial [Candidatus Angelobacter sp.]
MASTYLMHMLLFAVHSLQADNGPMHPLEKGGHIANIVNSIFGLLCAVIGGAGLWLQIQAYRITEKAVLPSHQWVVPYSYSIVALLLVLLVIGLALLWRSIRAETRMRLARGSEHVAATPAGVVPSPGGTNTRELSCPLSAKPLPELRPYVVAVSYKRLQHLPVLGFETQNVGKEVALEISIPDIKLGTSIVQFEGNYQRLTINESAYWGVLVKHDTGGFSTGNFLANEMRVQGKGEIIVPIQYKNANNLCYVTWARFELNASTESRIAVHNDAQELIKWPTASVQPIEATFPSTAPRPYLEVEDPIDERFGKTLFHFTNRGGDVAHNVQVQPLSINHFSVVFDVIPLLAMGETKTVIPIIPGIGINGGHDILNQMEKEWNGAPPQRKLAREGQTDEWPTQVTITYEDFTGRRFEANLDLVVFPINRLLRNKHALESPQRNYKTVEVRNIKFKEV